MIKHSPNVQNRQRTHERTVSLGDGLNQLVKRVLFYADGSTTRVLESLVGQTMQVFVHQQEVIEKQQLPAEVFPFFSHEGSFLYRVSSLYAGKILVSTNVVYACIQQLPTAVREDLYAKNIPLGKLISETETRRSIFCCSDLVSTELQPLYRHYPLPSGIHPVKQYTIMRQGQCWFYVCELFHLENIEHCCSTQILVLQ